MEPPKSSKSHRGKLSRSRAVQSSNNSSSSEKSDDEPQNFGSRLKLLRDRRSKKKSEESENTIVQIESTIHDAEKEVPPSKESSIAQSLKRRAFGFFRRSENIKSTEDVEAPSEPTVDASQSPELAINQQTLDVVVDVHCESEVKKEESRRRLSPEEESHDLIEEFQEDIEDEIRVQSSVDKNDDEEIFTVFGGDSTHRRRRWEKAEIKKADELVEDLKKPRRKQWAKGTASAEIRNITGKKIVVPKRSATAEPDKKKPVYSRSSKPVAAPRSKSLPKEEKKVDIRGFENDGFSSDHDEVLRIETINDCSPKIEIASANIEKIKDVTSTLSEEEKPVNDRRFSIEEIKEYIAETAESTENSDVKDRLPSETNESVDLVERKSTSRRRSSSKRKFSMDKRSVDEDEDENDEDEEEQETVLNVMDKKSRRSSSSSKIEIIPSNFFQRESSDETTISTNEEMHSSRKGSPYRSRSRSKSKSSRQGRRSFDDVASDRRRKTTSSSTRNSADEPSSSRRKAKSRTKKRQKRRERKQKDLEDLEEEAIKYVSVRIHRSDMLEADYITRHPMVKVHIVSAETGEYLRVKSKEGEADTLQPIVTRKFDFKEKRSMVPVWEEELIFELDFRDLLVEGKAAVVILFEIVDLLTFNEASVCYDQFGRDACWYKVAWAFLRPVGVSGIRHLDKKVRLQLYRPKKSFRKPSKNKCEVYKWWKSGSRDKYPSSLYVSVSGVAPPRSEPVFYEQLLQLNDLSDMRSDSQNILSAKTDAERREPAEPPKWTRLAAQSCQIPNETYLETEASENGCFYLAFSNDGKYLACVVSEEYDYPILVYKIDEGKIHARFSGHKNFVYSLSWTQDDRYLLSVSSDQTARFWDVREKIIEPVQSLPHPSYVYCGKFSLEHSNLVVTGCYDHVARVWARLRPSNERYEYELVQELEAHEAFVNAVCFKDKDESCLTADGVGVIVVWTVKRSRRSPIRREWQIARKIKIRELEGVPINTILMHPLGSRLLVHSRNGGLRLMDLVSGMVIKKYEGLKNQRIQITACISPCGGLLFCGGEDSLLNVWSVDSGKLLATYEITSHEKAVTCVDYHPYDHVLAFATYGAPVPVQILKFNREADGRSIGLKLLTMTTSTMSIKEQPTITRNGVRNLDKLSARTLNSSTNVSHLLNDYKDEDEVRRQLKSRLQRFMETGPNLRAKSMNRLNGIIEKIDRILMYATNQKSPAMDLESARNSLIFAVEERQPVEVFELEDRGKKARKQRSRSARNACSPTPKEIEFSKAFSDSAAFTRKVSRFSDDSSNSNRSTVHQKFVIERLELEKIEYVDTESGFKDSLDTIVDGKEDFPSDDVLDIESLRSDDTYVVEKEKTLSGSGERDSSDKSNATFIIESEVPVPKPRKRTGRIEVM